jgi:hypothetical protein
LLLIHDLRRSEVILGPASLTIGPAGEQHEDDALPCRF